MRDGERPVRLLAPDDAKAVALRGAIVAGDVAALADLLDADPDLATARIGDGAEARSLLHVATDWPGRFPNVAATVELLVARGADVGARFVGSHEETPLHWAASCDDVDAVDALLDAGADIDARGAVLGGGTALLDAVGFAQWRAARRLVERGAATTLFEAAALGLLDRVAAALDGDPPPSPDDVTTAFWTACHGGRRAAAALLLERGADRDWVGYQGCTPLDAAVRAGADDVVAWLRDLGARPGVEGST